MSVCFGLCARFQPAMAAKYSWVVLFQNVSGDHPMTVASPCQRE
jgi:hypothetical protein